MTKMTIGAYFLDIDRIQFQVFEKINDIVNLDDASLDQSESLDSRRSSIAKSANALINKIPDILNVIEIQIRHISENASGNEFLQGKLELYKDKVQYLKLKLKESQLVAYSLESQLTHKQRLEEYVKDEVKDDTDMRSDLFSGRSQTQNDAERPIDEQILTQNKNITSSLKLTKQLMTMSVMQTELNIDSLDQQSKDLGKLNDKLIDLESVLVKSRQIVKFIEKQDKRDKRRIYLSIGFLLLCCAWVLWRRVLKLPVKILVWSLLKFFGVFNWVVSKYPGESIQVSHIPRQEPIASISFQTSVDTMVKEQMSFLLVEKNSVYAEVETLTELTEKTTQPEIVQYEGTGTTKPEESLDESDIDELSVKPPTSDETDLGYDESIENEKNSVPTKGSANEIETEQSNAPEVTVSEKSLTEEINVSIPNESVTEMLEESIKENVKEPNAEPTEEGPVAKEPEEPTEIETVVDMFDLEMPVTNESVVEEPTEEDPTEGQPAEEEPTEEELMMEETVIEEPVMEPVVEELVVEESVSEEPFVEEHAVEESFEEGLEIEATTEYSIPEELYSEEENVPDQSLLKEQNELQKISSQVEEHEESSAEEIIDVESIPELSDPQQTFAEYEESSEVVLEEPSAEAKEETEVKSYGNKDDHGERDTEEVIQAIVEEPKFETEIMEPKIVEPETIESKANIVNDVVKPEADTANETLNEPEYAEKTDSMDDYTEYVQDVEHQQAHTWDTHDEF